MMQTTNRIAVAGATGRVGHHVVEVLRAQGHDVVPMSRSTGVDVITGAGLTDALDGVTFVIDAATGPSPDEQEATAFFTTAAHNLHDVGERAGVQGIAVVSIIGTDRFIAGYGVAKQPTSALTCRAPSRHASCARRSSTSSSRNLWTGGGTARSAACR